MTDLTPAEQGDLKYRMEALHDIIYSSVARQHLQYINNENSVSPVSLNEYFYAIRFSVPVI
jgi:hypothetical protein